MYIIRNKNTGEYVSNKSFITSKDIYKSKTFKRKADAASSISYICSHQKNKHNVNDYEILQVTISIIK